VSIFSSIDSQSLFLTHKLFKGRGSVLCEALPFQSQSRYAIGEVTIELDLNTVNQVIEELTAIGNGWLKDTTNDCFSERKQIMSYLLQQWISVGEEARRIHQDQTQNNVH
jgi:hypothetical protein